MNTPVEAICCPKCKNHAGLYVATSVGERKISDLTCINPSCECHKPSYSQRDHYHCWAQGHAPACGIPLDKHTQCCLCDVKTPSPSLDELKRELDEKYGAFSTNANKKPLTSKYIYSLLDQAYRAGRVDATKEIQDFYQKMIDSHPHRG